MAITFSGHWAAVDSDLSAIIAEAGDSFAWGGANYACVITRAARGTDPMEGGLWGEYSGRLTTRRALFDTVLPEEGDTITIGAQSFIVGKVTFDDLRPPVEILYRNNQAPK